MLLASSLPAHGEGETITVSGKTYQWIDATRRYVGDAVQSISGSVDNFLARDASVNNNESYVRLRLGYVTEEGGHAYPNNNIKLKVDLPKTSHKWSLVFESDPDELESLEEQQQDHKDPRRALEDTDGSIGAIRFMLNDWRHWENDIDVGIKAPYPFDPFVRFSTKRRYQLSPEWAVGIRHAIYYFSRDGFGERSNVLFSRPLDSSWTFFNSLDMRWQDEGQLLEFGEVLMFQQVYTERDTFLYRTGAFYQDHPRSALQSYFIDMTYRRRLHAHWLYGEIIPGVTWPASTDFKSVAALTLRLEVVFD